MELNTLIALSIIYIILTFLIDRWLKKKFQIEKSAGFLYQRVNKLHVVIEVLMMIIFIITQVVVAFVVDDLSMKASFITIIFIGSLTAVRAFMEWKYKRETRQYISSLFGVANIVFVFMMAVILFS